MTETDTTTKPAAKRERTPWRIYRIEPGDGEDAATTLILESAETFSDLREAEKDCARRATDEIGAQFVAAKCGTVFRAEQMTEVRVRRS